MNDRAAQMADEFVRSVHPEKIFGYLPGVGPASLAALYGMDEGAYLAVRRRYSALTQQAAAELRAEPGFAAALGRLPVTAGQTVVVVGESNTDAADSWLEILSHVLAGPDSVTLVNAAIAGQPTTMLQRCLAGALLQHRPEWVVVFGGANDALRYGSGATKPMVSIGETARNLAEMRRQSAAAGARLIWLTPGPFDPERVAAYPPFLGQNIWLEPADLRAVADVVRQSAADGDLLVDMSDVFGQPADPAMLRPDGLHPTLAGQQAIARAFVEGLAGPPGGD
jgi:lysophospholipase L1-like esterase